KVHRAAERNQLFEHQAPPPAQATRMCAWTRRDRAVRLNRQLACSLARAGACGFLRRPMRCCTPLAFPAPTANALCVHASAQSIHETDDFRWLALSRRFDLLAGLLLLQQLLQRVFVVVLKFFGLEVAGLGFDDV